MIQARVLLLLAAIGLSATAVGCGGAPSIPHPITSEADTDCLGCHQEGKNGAPRAPHSDRRGCTDCHQR